MQNSEKFKDLINDKIDKTQVFQIDDFNYVIIKQNWNYGECEKFQMDLANLISENNELRVIICTNHPKVYTLGRGKKSIEFIDQDKLNYPLFHIHRGGGMTFHHEGQLIIYPLINLRKNKLVLKDLIDCVLFETINYFNKNYKLDLIKKCEPLGIWANNSKIGSIGLGIKKDVSLHGLALNLFDNEIFNDLKSLSPCGLNGKIYSSISSLLDRNAFKFDFEMDSLQIAKNIITKL